MTHKPKTNLEVQSTVLIDFTKYLLNYKSHQLSIQLLSLLLGFFISTGLSTIPAQTGDWGIIASALIVTNQEIISKIIYSQKIYSYCTSRIILKSCLQSCNSIKIGILYGLFVDAFKLGS